MVPIRKLGVVLALGLTCGCLLPACINPQYHVYFGATVNQQKQADAAIEYLQDTHEGAEAKVMVSPFEKALNEQLEAQ